MTNPLTTPTNIPASTAVPRMPDGSPMPRAKAAAARARVRANELTSDEVEVVRATPHKLGLPEDFEQPEATGVYAGLPETSETTESSETEEQREEREFQEELLKEAMTDPGVNEPAQPIIKTSETETPAQKRAKTIAAKKAAAAQPRTLAEGVKFIKDNDI